MPCLLLALSLVQLHAVQSYAIGGFEVTVVDGVLEVDSAAASSGHTPVVATTPLPWLMAEVGEWKNRRTSQGMFPMQAGAGCGSTTQTIDAVKRSPSGDMLTLRGVLGGAPKACSERIPRNYSMVLSVTAESAATLSMAVALDPLIATSKQHYERMTISLAAQADEKVYGLGVQYSFRDFKGKIVPILTSEQGIGRGLQPLSTVLGSSAGNFHTTYSAIPHFMTSSMQSIYLQGSDYAIFDFSQDKETRITSYASSFTMRAIAGNTPLKLIEEYTTYSGRMAPLPKWVTSGPIIGYEGGTAAVAALHTRIVEAGIKPAAYWLQDWTGQRVDFFGKRLWWNWELDRDWYPDWDGLCQNLSMSTGTRLMTYVNPFLANTVSKQKPNAKRDFFKEAAAQGYLVKTQAGEPYILYSGAPSFSFGIVDFTNPAAAAWFSQVIQQNMAQECQSGWMADFSEYIPFDAQLFNGNPDTVHNMFPKLWAEVNRNATGPASDPDAPVFFMRASHTKSPEFSSLFWLGDQLVTWDEDDGLKTVLNGLISAGLSGLSLVHSDVGGYTMVNKPFLHYLRDRELLVRWMELSSVVDVVFRTHPGNLPDKSWQIYSDNSTLQCFGRLAELHSLLVPYRLELMHNASNFGRPLVRAMWLHYPNDEVAQTTGTQVMLGPDLLLAPALEKAQQAVEVYLPSGEIWVDPWTSKTYGSTSHPSNITLPAQMGFPVFLMRLGSAVSLTLGVGCKTLRSNMC